MPSSIYTPFQTGEGASPIGAPGVSDYERIETNPDMFGGGIGKAAEGLGRTLQKVSQDAFSVNALYGRVAADDQRNQFTKNADNLLYGDPGKTVQAPDGTMKPDTGVLGLRGQDALNSGPAAVQAIEKARQDGRANLSGPALIQYDNETSRIMQTARVTVSTHVQKEATDWYQTVNKTGEQQALQRITRAPDDPLVLQGATADLIKYRTQAAQISLGNSLSPEMQKSIIQGAKADALTTQLAMIAVKDPAKALTMADGNKDILGEAYPKIANELRTRAEAQTADKTADDAFNTHYVEGQPAPTPAANLPVGMQNNNPGNLKFFAANDGKYAGVVGPSKNTDQGTPQIVFATPEAGMKAAYQLALEKYNSGLTTANQIIADKDKGWTPGNKQAAANIAATAGVGPDDDLKLNTPEGAAKFLRGVVTQEHGGASKDYTDQFIRSVVSGKPTVAGPSGRANYATVENMGDPLTPGWKQKNIVPVSVAGATFEVNKAAAPAFQGFLQDLAAEGYNIKASGGYNYRNIRGSSTLSQHSFGNAIDINAPANAQGGSKSDLPPNVAELAAKHGLIWGGNWSGKTKDPMHFEWAGPGGTGASPQQAQDAGGHYHAPLPPVDSQFNPWQSVGDSIAPPAPAAPAQSVGTAADTSGAPAPAASVGAEVSTGAPAPGAAAAAPAPQQVVMGVGAPQPAAPLASVLVSEDERAANAYTAIENDPNLSEEQKQRAAARLGRRIGTHRIATEATAKAIKQQSDAASETYLRDMYSGDPQKMQGMGERIAADHHLTGEAVERLESIMDRRLMMSGDPSVQWGKGFADLFKRVTLPMGDPNRISDPQQLVGALAANQVNFTGFDKLNSYMKAFSKAPDQQIVMQSFASIMNGMKRQLSNEGDSGIPGMPGIKDPVGEKVFYTQYYPQMLMELEKAIQGGKEREFLSDTKHFDEMAKQLRDPADMRKQALSSDAAPSLTPDTSPTAANLPPAPPAANPDAWRQLVSVKAQGIAPDGSKFTFSPAQIAKPLQTLFANPSDQMKEFWDRQPGPGGKTLAQMFGFTAAQAISFMKYPARYESDHASSRKARTLNPEDFQPMKTGNGGVIGPQGAGLALPTQADVTGGAPEPPPGSHVINGKIMVPNAAHNGWTEWTGGQ